MPKIIRMVDIIAEHVFALLTRHHTLPIRVHIGIGTMAGLSRRRGRRRIGFHAMRAIVPPGIRGKRGKQDHLGRRLSADPSDDFFQIGAKTLWLQLRVVNIEAAELAAAAELNVIMDRCVKIEHGRYSGSLHWVGMNTEIISARRGQRYF